MSIILNQRQLLIVFIACICLMVFVSSTTDKPTNNKKKKTDATGGENGSKKAKKKNILDYTDAELEGLYKQWEDNDDDKLSDDELPEHERPPMQIDLNMLKDLGAPEEMMKLTKKGQPVMMFIGIAGNPTRAKTDQITGLWQTSLYNNHIEVQSYVIEDDRAMFMFKDGALAWDAKDFLVQQDDCFDVTIEGQVYPGKGASSKSGRKKKKSEL